MSNSYERRRFIQFKYRVAWYFGALISFLLYYSGIIQVYHFIAKKYFKSNKAVVLMYHRVSDDKKAPDITISVNTFESQIAFLKKNYQIVTLDDIVKFRAKKAGFNSDILAITFDDGFKDNFTEAYPVLKKYKIPAAIFVASCFIGDNEGLSEDDMAIMQEGGITFGAHTATHKVLSELERDAADREIRDSKTALEDILKQRVRYFAYPYGKRGRDFTDESMQLVRESDYVAAFATDNGFITAESNIFALNRIGMRDFPLFVLKARLSGIFESRIVYLFRKTLRL